MQKSIIYYSDNSISRQFREGVFRILEESSGPIPIIAVVQQPLGFRTADHVCEIVVGPKPREVPSIFEQILIGLTVSTADWVFLCEHDLLYPPDYFINMRPRDFDPQSKVCYANGNVIRSGPQGFYARHRGFPLSNQAAFRLPLIENMKQRVRMARDGTFGEKVVLCEIAQNRWEKRQLWIQQERYNPTAVVDISHQNNISQLGQCPQGPDLYDEHEYWGSNRTIRKKLGIEYDE